ncbi:hypothetical protein OG453_30355 [Streptomyces sp. NBC_01381]|uniref:hypothetical protein n=1 Tax=Streptomyces sp. NBC_01381 TaxID=2903845 RepID=UPI0022574128|nr:hypothetical protein [Streptomyces sp. NBC_01381]MCX4670950.1 hypothetical protein [Streptomyces sp. NBC_01381]
MKAPKVCTARRNVTGSQPSEAPVTLPASAWVQLMLMVPMTVLITVIGLIWPAGIIIPPARQYALEVGKQTTGMMRALTR